MYFFIKNFKTKKPSNKLDHVKIGSLSIQKTKKPFDYELKLSTDAKIFSIFNIFLLEPANPDTPLATLFRNHTGKKDEYEMENILQQNNQNYFIRWKNLWRNKRYLGTGQNFWELPNFFATVPPKPTTNQSKFSKTKFSEATSNKKISNLKLACSANCFLISNSDICAISLSTRIIFFFFQNINFALQTIEFNKKKNFLKFFISFFPDTNQFKRKERRQVTIHQIFADAFRITTRSFANFAFIGGSRIFSVKTNLHDKKTRLENGKHSIAKRNWFKNWFITNGRHD